MLGHLRVDACPPSAAYMRYWIGSALVQVMACRLFGAKPLPEPMLTYCQLDPYEQNKIGIKVQYFSFTKMHSIMSSAKWRPFCPGRDELRTTDTDTNQKYLKDYKIWFSSGPHVSGIKGYTAGWTPHKYIYFLCMSFVDTNPKISLSD